MKTLPFPTRTGEADESGWDSRIWTRGSASLRIRSRGSSAVLHEFKQGVRIRQITGDMDFIVKMAKEWFDHHGASPDVDSPRIDQSTAR